MRLNSRYVVAGFTGLFLLMAVGVAVGQGSNEVVIACAKATNGNTRIVAAADECRNSETVITWNIEGPRGPKGEPGAPGVIGGYYTVSFDNLPDIGVPSPPYTDAIVLDYSDYFDPSDIVVACDGGDAAVSAEFFMKSFYATIDTNGIQIPGEWSSDVYYQGQAIPQTDASGTPYAYKSLGFEFIAGSPSLPQVIEYFEWNTDTNSGVHRGQYATAVVTCADLTP